MTERIFHAGEVIFHQGDVGNSFYQIESGSVGIYVEYGAENERKLTELAEGRLFGEMAVIDVYPRSATAVALTAETKVLEYAAEELQQYLQKDPGNSLLLVNNIGDRLRDLTKDYTAVNELIDQMRFSLKKSMGESFMEKLGKYAAAFKTSMLPQKKSVEERFAASGTKLSDGYSKPVQKFSKGTVIFKEGETGDSMYGVHWGSVGIYTGYGTPEEKCLTMLMPNTFFGEMGMVSGKPRSATAVALEDETIVEIIKENDFEELFSKNPPKAFMILSHLSSRLRKLTKNYTDACSVAYKITGVE